MSVIVLSQNGIDPDANQEQIFFRSGVVPFILPGDFTMGNNGAITMSAALQRTYTDGYIWLQANDLYSTSPAGWYYVKMSSTTVGVVYSDVYALGPTAPPTSVLASPVPFTGRTGPGARTGAIGADIYSGTLPGSALGDWGKLTCEGAATTIGPGYKLINMRLNFGEVAKFNQGTDRFGNFNIWTRNNGDQKRQFSSTFYNAAGYGTTTDGNGEYTIDTTVAQPINVGLQVETSSGSIVINNFALKIKQ